MGYRSVRNSTEYELRYGFSNQVYHFLESINGTSPRLDAIESLTQDYQEGKTKSLTKGEWSAFKAAAITSAEGTRLVDQLLVQNRQRAVTLIYDTLVGDFSPNEYRERRTQAIKDLTLNNRMSVTAIVNYIEQSDEYKRMQEEVNQFQPYYELITKISQLNPVEEEKQPHLDISEIYKAQILIPDHEGNYYDRDGNKYPPEQQRDIKIINRLFHHLLFHPTEVFNIPNLPKSGEEFDSIPASTRAKLDAWIRTVDPEDKDIKSARDICRDIDLTLLEKAIEIQPLYENLFTTSQGTEKNTRNIPSILERLPIVMLERQQRYLERALVYTQAIMADALPEQYHIADISEAVFSFNPFIRGEFYLHIGDYYKNMLFINPTDYVIKGNQEIGEQPAYTLRPVNDAVISTLAHELNHKWLAIFLGQERFIKLQNSKIGQRIIEGTATHTQSQVLLFLKQEKPLHVSVFESSNGDTYSMAIFNAILEQAAMQIKNPEIIDNTDPQKQDQRVYYEGLYKIILPLLKHFDLSELPSAIEAIDFDRLLQNEQEHGESYIENVLANPTFIPGIDSFLKNRSGSN